MSSFEERNPRLWAAADRIGVLVLGGLLFWLFSVAVITLPAALTGLYAVVATLFTEAPGETFGRFWRAFRRSFLTALILGALDLVVGVVLYLDMRILWGVGLLWTKAATFLFGSVAIVALLVNVFAWPLLAWYPQPFGKLVRRSFLLAAAHPFWSIGGLAGGVLAVLLLTLLPGWLLALLPLLGPGLFATVSGLCAWQVMKRYAGPDDEIAE